MTITIPVWLIKNIIELSICMFGVSWVILGIVIFRIPLYIFWPIFAMIRLISVAFLPIFMISNMWKLLTIHNPLYFIEIIVAIVLTLVYAVIYDDCLETLMDDWVENMGMENSLIFEMLLKLKDLNK